jgi:4-hydroxy-3-methylbut-2-enyl diphosphate reductase
MNVTIDQKSGYCFGVEYAIQMAEDEMKDAGFLYCLGDIVHNDMEVERLYKKGLRIIDHQELQHLKDCKVLIRAHGEPPSTYKIALENNIELIDASCPVVLKLQNRVKNSYEKIKQSNGQVVIYGKPGHAEVIGLTGQTSDEAIIVTEHADIDKIDYSRPSVLFSQTTKSTQGFYDMKSKIEHKYNLNPAVKTEEAFEAHDSICRQVSNREPRMKSFSQEHDVIVFVSGKKSSNGKALYQVCKNQNDRSYFLSDANELNPDWFVEHDSVGICGATSTPMWLMEEVAQKISTLKPSK